MSTLFLDFELAKVAKEKGIQVTAICYYDRNGKLSFISFSKELSILPDSWITAPLYQQIVDWFQSNKNITIDTFAQYTGGMDENCKNEYEFSYKIMNWENDSVYTSTFKSKERVEVMKQAIIKAFELL